MKLVSDCELMLSPPIDITKGNESDADMNRRYLDQIEKFEDMAQKLLKFLDDSRHNFNFSK